VARPPPRTLFEREITEVGRMAHARRKFVELHVANKSKIARAAIEVIAKLYDVERDASDLSAHERLQQRRTRVARVVGTLQDWLLAQRVRVSDGTATAQAIGYSLNRRSRTRAAPRRSAPTHREQQ
jgi:hypothetical protein